MWVCTKCGATNSGNTSGCFNCGTEKSQTGKKQISGMNAVFIAALAVLVVCGIVVAINSSNPTVETVKVVEYVVATSEPTPFVAPTSTPAPVLVYTPAPTANHSTLSSSGKTISNTGVPLEYPSESDFYYEPFSATVKASRVDGSIYIMPMPKSGNGNLGTVRNGTVVTIWAARKGFYFFETPDGVMGWNGTGYFVVE